MTHRAAYLAVKMALSILVLTTTILNLAHLTESAPLSSYLMSSFNSPDPSLPFNHLAINNVTGDVYIGARERLYQLTSDLTLKQTVILGPCTRDYEENVNKLLVVAPSPENRLITCGGCDGFCETRSLEDISADVTRHDENNAQWIVATGDAPTVGAVVLGANTTTGILGNALFLFTAVSNGAQAVSKHDMAELLRRRSIVSHYTTENKFLQVIFYKDFLYFFMQRNAKAYIGRLCPNSLDYRLESYCEIEVQCGSHTVIQAAHIGPAGSQLADSLGINNTDGVLYAVFGDGASPAESALCLYRMSDIQQSFQTAVLGCIRDGDDSGVPIDYLDGRCDIVGVGSGYQPPDDGHLCTASVHFHWTFYLYSYAAGVTPVQGTPLLPLPTTKVTSIITTRDRDHTVAVVGTRDGDLHKIHIVNASFGSVYETVPLGGGSVLRDIFLDEEKEQLTLATSADSGSQVVTLSLVNCGQYQTCDACIGGNDENDGDPYCGWCTLEAKCTRHEECPLASESTRWLPYNALQCVGISNVQPGNEIPYEETEQQITITVQQLPSLSGSNQYRCAFDSYTVSATTNNDDVTCLTPPTTDLPSIPQGASSVTVVLSIIATETDVSFVSTQVTFFDCGLIQSCSSCVTSPWPCDWCVYDSRCTHDNSTCQAGETIVIGDNNPIGSGNRGQGFCPQLLGTAEEFLLPVNVPSGYTVLAKNLPTDQARVQSYDCIIHVEGNDVEVQSIDYSDTYVVCPERLYNYEEDILRNNVSVSVSWNGNGIDDMVETHVTLYKCSVNSGSCSRCLSPEATPPMLQCGWCETDCDVLQSDVCQTNTFLWQNQTQLCNGPQITDFFPQSGPMEGETRLEITGTDLGVSFADIIAVSVADYICDLDEMAAYYRPGESVSCITTHSGSVTSGSVIITVNHNTKIRTAISDQSFMYRDPGIAGFSPMGGLAAGGTRVTIKGEFLATGRDITAAFGDYSCIDLTVAENEASCTTTGISQSDTSTHQLTMTFDTALRISQGSFEYMPNPQVESVDRSQSIEAGGIRIGVIGSGFSLIQHARIVASSKSTGASSTEMCDVESDRSLVCPSPASPSPSASRRKRAADAEQADLSLDLDSYILDLGVMSYYPDPVYYSFSEPNHIKTFPDNAILELKGSNLTSGDITRDDIRILIGPDSECLPLILEPSRLRCQLPEQLPGPGDSNGTLGEGPTKNLPEVVIFHGNLRFHPGYMSDAKYNVNLLAIVLPVAGLAIVFVICLALLLLWKQRKYSMTARAAKEEVRMTVRRIDDRKREVANTKKDLREAREKMSVHHERIKKHGVPARDYVNYVTMMLFRGLDVHPDTSDPDYVAVDDSLMSFTALLKKKEFVLDFIKELDDKMPNQEKQRRRIASLLAVTIMSGGNTLLFTEVVTALLRTTVSSASDRRGKYSDLFCQSNSIADCLRACWTSLMMYSFIQRYAMHPLYMLYQAMKTQCERGPIDAITGEAYYTLNYHQLLACDFTFREITLFVVDDDNKVYHEVKVLDVDSVEQAKQKILDSLWQKGFSLLPRDPDGLDLVWHQDGGKGIRLQAVNENTMGQGPTRLNTLQSYKIHHGCRVAILPKQSCSGDGYQLPSVEAPPTNLYTTLQLDTSLEETTAGSSEASVLNEEAGVIHLKVTNVDPAQSYRAPENIRQMRAYADRNLTIPHMLQTKVFIGPYLEGVMDVMFNMAHRTPYPIKHLFDTLDDLATEYPDGSVTETAEIWKRNCMAEFWTTFLTVGPSLFDMPRSSTADKCLAVVTDALHHATMNVTPGKTEDPEHLPYLQDFPLHVRMVETYCQDMTRRPRSFPDKLERECARISEEHKGKFSHQSTVLQLYNLTTGPAAELMASGIHSTDKK